ncbi:MAG: hypothetical protein DSY46_02550 [Hydrogenimonas sp.]|nr:MAG: hypothetical protein DSY46_02550 [Hydrogenimonas sp.]
MIYMVGAIVLLLLVGVLYRSYQKNRDLRGIAIAVGLIVGGIFFISFARSMIVYKPLMVLHIALTLLYWYALVIYLIRQRLHYYLLLAPLFTIAAFFLIGIFFKEV